MAHTNLDRNNAFPGLDVVHVPTGKRGTVAQSRGVGWLPRNPDGTLDESEDAETRAGCLVEWTSSGDATADSPVPHYSIPDIMRDDAKWCLETENVRPIPYDELGLPEATCNGPIGHTPGMGVTVCGVRFVPTIGEYRTVESYCSECRAREDARRAKELRRQTREFKARAAIARRAMPRLAAWCAAVNRLGTVHYLIPHVAKSGMSRCIELFAVRGGDVDVCWPDSEPRQGGNESGRFEETPAAFRVRLREYRDTFARLPGGSWRHRCFVVGGCGMDMVFATVDELGFVFGHADWGNKIRRNGLSRAE